MRFLNANFRNIWDFWGPVLLTISLYIGIRQYIGEARYIPSGSMLPGLKINDRLIVEKITLRQRSPKRGEIVVFNSPYSFDRILRRDTGPSPLKCGLVNFPLIVFLTGLSDPACDAYIKRVVAIGGDQVTINPKGEVFLNGIKRKESYVTNFCNVDRNYFADCKALETLVPSGHVLVLGDNRRNSWDGRYWPGSHFLPEKEILGRAVWRFWPLNRIGFLRS